MKRFSIVLAFAIIFGIVAFSSASAVAADPVGCSAFGGHWSQIDATHGKCKFPADHYWSRNYCSAGYGAIDHWVFDGIWYITHQTCGFTYSVETLNDFDVVANTPVDGWNGNCGVHISNPPLNGSISVVKSTAQIRPNVKGVCDIYYYDYQGNLLSNFYSPAWLYYVLDNSTRHLYDEGKLNFYVYENGTWNTCSLLKFLDEGDYGTLTCFSSTPLSFGIGTGIGNFGSVGGDLFP